MNGCLIPHTPIAVDFWKIRECPQARIFFLTHLHGDHIAGLTSSWSYPIYCSEITGKLLVYRHGIREDLIHSLQADSGEIIYLDNERQQQMTVTAIDANHCPGAVMFLMQGYFGTILHTGDFRYNWDMIHQSVLSQFSGKVDVLYLDNTYCSPSCVFPTRDESTSNIIEIIEQHPTKDVLIAMRNLGKENLLCKIALHFHEWISVPDNFYQTLVIIGAPDVFDNSSKKHRIRVVPFHKISNKFVRQVNEERETIVILPTALYHGIEATPYENNDKVFVVPYSDHSSYTELRDFVAFIKPKKIIPIVKSNARGPFGLSVADRADMSRFAKFTSNRWNSKVDIPVSVQAFMNCRNSKVLAMEQKGQKRKQKLKQPQSKKVKRGIYYDSPKSISKESVSEGAYSTENEKDNSKVSEKDTQPVKRILFKDDTPKPKADERERKGTKGEHSILNDVEDFDSVEQDSCAEIIDLTVIEDRHGKKYWDKQVNILDKQHKLISSHYRNGKPELEVATTQGSSIGTKRTRRRVNIDDSNASNSLQLKTRQHMKVPSEYLSTTHKLAFDRTVGLKTYSKIKANMFDSIDRISAGKTKIVENRVSRNRLERTPKSNEDHPIRKILQSAKYIDKKASGSGRAKFERKCNIPDLKQSTLFQYVTKKTKDDRERSASPTEREEMYIATKSIKKPVGIERHSIETRSMADLQNHEVLLKENESDDEDDFVQNNLNEFSEHNETGDKSGQKNGSFIIVTDSQDEPEEPDIAKKDTEDVHEDESEDLDCGNDVSVIAQAGSQVLSTSLSMETDSLDQDEVIVTAKYKERTDEIEQLEDSFLDLDNTKEISTENIKDIGHTHDNFKKDASSCEKECQKGKVSVGTPEITEVLKIESSHEDNSCLTVEDLSTIVNIGTQKGMDVERTDNMEYNIDSEVVTNSEELTNSEVMPNTRNTEDNDMSTIVNIGTQKEIRGVENAEGAQIIGQETIEGPGEMIHSKGHRKSKSEDQRKFKGNCRKCELDAFRQVLERLENCKLKKAGDTKQNTSTCKIKKRNEKYMKCSFIVKPVGQ